MRGQTPTLHCDADDGNCGTWDVDYFDALASSVGGVKITRRHRAPGWVSTDDTDHCPEHIAEAGEPA